MYDINFIISKLIYFFKHLKRKNVDFLYFSQCYFSEQNIKSFLGAKF